MLFMSEVSYGLLNSIEFQNQLVELLIPSNNGCECKC